MATNFLALRSSALPTVNAVNLNYSTLTGSTITAISTITAPTFLYSTLRGSTVNASILTAIGITLSTLTVSSINNSVPGTGTGVSAFSTLGVSSITTSLTQYADNSQMVSATPSLDYSTFGSNIGIVSALSTNSNWVGTPIRVGA